MGVFDDFSNWIDKTFNPLYEWTHEAREYLEEWAMDQVDKIFTWFEDSWDDMIRNIIIGISLFMFAYALGEIPLIAWVVEWAMSAWGTIAGWATALYGYWNDFLDWMHWDTVKDAHDVGYIVSPEYREAVNEVYNQISEFSEELGLGSGFMLLALQNARNVIMDVGSFMGHPYDINEVDWVFMMGGYLQEFNNYAEEMVDNPGGLITDIQEYFERDLVNLKARTQIALIDTTTNIIGSAKALAQNVERLKSSIAKTIYELPDKIGRPIYEALEAGFDTVDNFLVNEFTPALEILEDVTGVLTIDVDTHKGQLSVLSQQVLNPGEMLSNIDALPKTERLRQEAQITEITTRSFSTEATERNEVIDETNKELTTIADALQRERRPPAFLQLEYEGAPKPTSISNGVFASWQVGDY